jgi:hypothetical protein
LRQKLDGPSTGGGKLVAVWQHFLDLQRFAGADIAGKQGGQEWIPE